MEKTKNEISYLFTLIKNYFLNEIDRVTSQGIKINIIGNLNKLPKDIRKILYKTINSTKNNKTITVNLAINYGSKNEIIMALKKIKKNISIKNIEKNLYTKDIPDPDILIRTGGHQRLSNFMLWQLAYSELFFISKLWPDFNPNDLEKY